MNNFVEKLQYSLAKQQTFDIVILRNHIPNCREIVKTKLEQDRAGIDYIARLDDGAEIFIDAKTREKGCSRYWKFGEPELALEIYGVAEKKKLGWTLSDSTNVDYILYTFDKTDSDDYFFLPFQLLKKVFRENGKNWVKRFGYKVQQSDSWHSWAVFVPASVVLATLFNAMKGKFSDDD